MSAIEQKTSDDIDPGDYAPYIKRSGHSTTIVVDDTTAYYYGRSHLRIEEHSDTALQALKKLDYKLLPWAEQDRREEETLRRVLANLRAEKAKAPPPT